MTSMFYEANSIIAPLFHLSLFVDWHPKLSHFEENLHPNLSHPNCSFCLIFQQGLVSIVRTFK